MNLTLLVENNPKIESFYRLNLLTWLGLETTVAPDSATALKLLSAPASGIQLIIARAKIGKEQSAAEIVKFLQEKNLNIPLIVIGPMMRWLVMLRTSVPAPSLVKPPPPVKRFALMVRVVVDRSPSPSMMV